MPDIEETIFKLSIDGSAYVEGANKLSDSTKKLSDAQEKANAKLAELQKSQNGYKKALDEVNAVIKANEKETVELTKQLNALQNSSKGASAEATRLKNALRDISTNTKEFKLEAKELNTNLANTTNQLKVHTKEVQAAEKANGAFTGSVTKAYSGLRILANVIPGLGIGGIVALIAGPLVNAFGEWYDSITQTSNALKLLAENQKNINEVTAAADKDAGKQINDLKILYEAATNVNLTIEDRRKAVKALQAEFPDYFANIKTETILNGDAKKQYDELTLSILATARATAAKTKLAELEGKQLDLDHERQKVIIATTNELIKAKKSEATSVTTSGGGIAGTGGTSIAVSAEENRRIKETAINQRREQRLAQIDQDKKDLQAQEDFLKKFAGLANLADVVEKDLGKKKPTAKDRVGKQAKEITNIYEQELNKLKLDIAKLDAKGFTTEESITKAIDEDFRIRAAAFDKALAKGQLTPEQVTKLNVKLAELRKLILTESIKTFNQQRAALLERIDSELSAIETEAALKRVANIQDSFERQRQAIVSESDKLIKARQTATQKQIAEIQKSNILTPGEIKNSVEKANAAMDEFILQVNIATNQKLQQLAFDTFEKVSEDLQQSLKSKQFDVSALSLLDIQRQTELLQQGKISYEQYQKELTRIAKEESDKRLQLEIANLRIEINRRQSELRDNRALSDDQQERLLKEIREREAQVNALEKTSELDQGKGSKTDAAFKARIDKFVTYTQAIGNLAQNVISFWQQANAAESAALERSIALQQRRVDAAQRIAERGNAQYLKQEQDRLTDLNTQRENAARKQLGINAALQGSEILVSLISGIAQGAKLGGALGAITSVAAIVAAIAGAFAIAQSLKPPTPTFFVGTKDTGRGGALDSKGGFAATLHPNEAVLPAHRNKAYKPAVNAIYDGTIPPEMLNRFVTNYHKIKAVPLPNYERIKDAAELHIGSDGRMSLLLSEQNKKMDENTLIQKQVLRALKSMGVNVNMDKNGIAVSVMEAVEQIKINSRA